MLFWSGILQLCVWSVDGWSSPTVPPLCVPRWCQLHSLSMLLPLHLYVPILVLFLSPSSRGVHPPILPPSRPPSDVWFFVVHVASCLPVSVTICLSADVSVSSWLPSSSFNPPFMRVSLHIYIIMLWKICVCDNISILWRLPVGTWDTLISWWASCPGSSLLLSLCLFKPFRLTSTLHLTHSD